MSTLPKAARLLVMELKLWYSKWPPKLYIWVQRNAVVWFCQSENRERSDQVVLKKIVECSIAVFKTSLCSLFIEKLLKTPGH